MKFPFAIVTLVHSVVGFGVKYPSYAGVASREPYTTFSRDVRRKPLTHALHSTKLPTMEQLSSDSFMTQIDHASEIIPLLADASNHDNLTEMISAQLSHSDGIRGFFVAYLTGAGPSPADEETMPLPLSNAIERNENKKELISLACMNVIMPTGMITMHTDEEMAKSSETTAARGKVVAKKLLAEDEMKKQCAAILRAAQNETVDSEEDKYWVEFFKKWGYGEKEIENIARTFDDLVFSR